MDWKLLVIFVALSVANVVIQTIKSLVTIKCGKTMAAFVNAVAYGLYTVVTVYTMCDLPLMVKAGVVAVCNLVGVFIVKWVEEIARKDKLWKIEVTVPVEYSTLIRGQLQMLNLPFSYIDVNKYHLFNIYCATQKESARAKKLLASYPVKYFVAESKTL